MLYFIEDAWTRAVITISCRWTPSDILLPVSLDVRLRLIAFHSILSETSWASELILYINSFLTRFAPNWYSGSSQEKKDLKHWTVWIKITASTVAHSYTICIIAWQPLSRQYPLSSTLGHAGQLYGLRAGNYIQFMLTKPHALYW